MVNEEECKIIECFATKNGQKIMIEVEYDVNGETRKRGWGFSLDAFDSGRFINLIDLKIKEQKEYRHVHKANQEEADERAREALRGADTSSSKPL